jgi:hypothetical protein
LKGQARVRAIRARQDDQVFLKYNDYDAFDLALNLGYLERATRFVSSVACQVEMGGLGMILVEGRLAERRQMPVAPVEAAGDGLTLISMQLGTDDLERQRALLALPIRARWPHVDPEDVRFAADTLLCGVALANQAYFRQYLSVPTRPEEGDPRGAPGLHRMLAEVAGHQIFLLESVLEVMPWRSVDSAADWWRLPSSG